MKYNKFVTPLMAGALALSIGLVGCGGAKNDAKTPETVVEETTGETESVDPATDEGTVVDENAAQQAADANAAGATEEGEVTEISPEDEKAIADLEAENKGHYVLYDDWYDWYDYYVADMRGWSTAFTGYTNTGETLYYAENAAGTEAALFVVSPNGRYYTSYVGDVVYLGNNRVAIVDDYTGNSFQFTANQVDYNGNVYISLGNYGSGVFSPCAVSDVISIMDSIETYNYDLKYW